MEPSTIFSGNIFDTIVNLLAVSGVMAWVSTLLSNKRGSNKALDFILDVIELLAANIGKSKNDPNSG